MRLIVRKIDRALKQLYRLDDAYKAEDFLLRRPIAADVKVGNAALQGTLYVQGDHADLNVGIYLSKSVRRRLATLRRRPDWTTEQLDAFAVAAEEVSHFHYLLFHATAGRSVSHLELEVQGEVDKFLVTFFSLLEGRRYDQATFDGLLEQLFFRFRLVDGLSSEQRERYQSASLLARRFVLRWRRALRATSPEKAFLLLRRFYRAGPAERMCLAAE